MLIDRVAAMAAIETKANADRLVSLADVRDALNSLEGIDPATLAPKWISVKERLPELKESVLLYFNEGNMAVGYWFEKDENFTFWSAWTDNGWFSDCDCEPLYWMPLPEPPKGGEKE